MGFITTMAWWAGFFYLGAVAFLLLRPIWHNLADRGYALAKVVGLVGFTYILWILGSLHLLPFSWWAAWGVALGLGMWAAWQLKSQTWTAFKAQMPWPKLIIEEVIFSLCLGIWALVRSYNGRIEGVEKLMDAAILNGLLRSQFFPPQDVWLAGHTINYYYFGHLLVAALVKLTFVPAQYAFNLGLAGTFALCVVLVFSLVMQLTSSPVAAAVSCFLLTLSSNLDPAIASFKKTKDYIFFASTRLDPYTINEFPLYSFVVADLHAHTLDLPVAIGIVYLLYLVLESRELSWQLAGCLALLVGATGPTNSFDLLIYGGLTAAVLQLRSYIQSGYSFSRAKQALGEAAAIGLLSGVLYLPFYVSFHAPVGGIGVELFRTPLTFILINFGILLFICLPILPMSLPPLRILHTDKQKFELVSTDWFAVVLVVFALLLMIVPEFVFLKDIYFYQNPPYARANTIFKVYYQAWVLLSIAAGYGLWLSRKIILKWKLNDLYILGVGAMLAMSLVGTWSAVKAYRDNKASTQAAWQLNGYAYLTVENPDQLALITYINQHITGQPELLEATGESYTQRSKVSAYTGLPVPLGWASHEWGWRYSPTEWNNISQIMGQVEQVYHTTDPSQLKQELANLGVNYVVFSDVERQQYNVSDFPALEQLAGTPVFVKGNYALYKVP